MLFAVLLVTLCFASAPPKVELPKLGIAENPAFLGAIILLSVAFAVLSYTISTAIQNASAIAWSKEQLREVIVGVIIVILVYGANVTANEMIKSMTGHNNAVELGSAVLDGLIGDLEMIYGKIGEAYFSVAVQQGMSVSIVEAVPPIKFFFMQPAIYYANDSMPYYGISPVLQMLSQASSQITIQILSFKVLKLLLLYIGGVVPGFLLPIGFAFRVFPMTKRTGDTLIALSLGALFMLPASLVVVGELKEISPLDNVRAAERETFYDNVDPVFFSQASAALITGLCQNTAVKIAFGFGEFFWGTIFGLIASAPEAFTTFFFWFDKFVSMVWPWVIYGLQTLYGLILAGIVHGMDMDSIYARTVKPIVEILMPAVSEITMFSIISIITIATITYTGTKSISTALGGEHTFYGLTRMI